MINRLIEIAIYVYNITITKGVSMKIEVNQIKTNKKNIEVNQIKTNKKNIEVHIIPTEDMRYEEI